MKLDINHDKSNNRFSTNVDDKNCYLNYKKTNENVLDMTYTYVPEGLRHQGIGGTIVDEALKFARSNNYKVKPSCSFVGKYINEHQEYQDLVTNKA